MKKPDKKAADFTDLADFNPFNPLIRGYYPWFPNCQHAGMKSEGLTHAIIAQALSYMKATQVEVGLIVNFGEDSLYWKRLVRKFRVPTGV